MEKIKICLYSEKPGLGVSDISHVIIRFFYKIDKYELEILSPATGGLLMTTFYKSHIIRYLEKLFGTMFSKVQVQEQGIPR